MAKAKVKYTLTIDINKHLECPINYTSFVNDLSTQLVKKISNCVIEAEALDDIPENRPTSIDMHGSFMIDIRRKENGLRTEGTPTE